MDIFSARVKWLRERKGLTQAEVAESIGMSQSGYTKIEQGQREPKLEVLARFPTILDESVDFMIGVIDYTREIQLHSEKLILARNSVKFSKEHISTFKGDEPEDVRENFLMNLDIYTKKIDEEEKQLKLLISEIPMMNNKKDS